MSEGNRHNTSLMATCLPGLQLLNSAAGNAKQAIHIKTTAGPPLAQRACHTVFTPHTLFVPASTPAPPWKGTTKGRNSSEGSSE